MIHKTAQAFALRGSVVVDTRYGQGHINETHLVVTDIGHLYILQRINHHVFRDVPALMHNISLITGHLAKADPRPRHVLQLIPTQRGGAFYLDEDGNYWRMYDFVTDSICLQQAQTLEDFRQSAVAFGAFQSLLSDFPAGKLHETIPRFHDTPDRYRQLHEAIADDKAGRVRHADEEIAFTLAHEAEAGLMTDMLQKGELLLRVTHNDTKLNNVMLDAQTRQALCIIDLDTVMPGLAANDFGDSIRFGASTVQEDERDLSRVRLSPELYQAFASGFLGECGALLTDKEIETLPLGAKLMTLECGVRFLADYLNGDTYFHTRYPEHNLHRCRTQFKLVRDMEVRWQQMTDIVREIHRGLGREG